MPFKSEKQRRYLWANEPKVAKKWADEAKARKSEPKKRSKRRSSR